MSFKDLQSCGRKDYLRNNVPSGIKKASILRKICKEALLSLPLNASEKDVNHAVDALFALHLDHMLGFEAESERLRMRALLWRYIQFERGQGSSKILAESFSNKVKVMGKEHTISAHRLIDRGTAVECVRYIYKAPELTYNSRVDHLKPEKDADLLALQRTGEAELARLGIKKPVFGSFYYLKARTDSGTKGLDNQFESSLGNNIINHHFTKGEEKNLEQEYANLTADPAKCSDDSKDCYDCIYNDLCHTEFVKRKLTELPAVEETPLDQIMMTPQQREFVLFDNGQCRVNAVAGSGKTTIVVLRTCRIIEDGCDPSQILMITFTDKACQEMRSRLRRYAKGSALAGANIDTDKIVVETFNSFGQKLLDIHYAKLGFSKKPELIDEVTKKDILVELLEQNQDLPMDYRNPFMNLPNAAGAVTQLYRLMDAFKASHVETVKEVEDLVNSNLKPRAAQLLRMYQQYNDKLVAMGLIDFEDQLRLMLQLQAYGVFDDLPFKHIVVDEFQDSNKNQIDLILEMAKTSKVLESIVVVGDELQAIYGFRDATPDNLVNFSQYFPNMIDIKLEDNFRSQSPIIQMANKIIEKEARIAKVIRAHRKETGVDPVLLQIEKADEEYDLYARQAIKLIKNGVSPKEIAVLCRTKTELINVQKTLEDAGVPTILRVPEIVGDAPYVKSIIALASFLKNHSNVLDFALYWKSLGNDPFDSDVVKQEAEDLGKKWDELASEEERLLMFMALTKEAAEDYVGEAFLEEIMSKGFHTVNQVLDFCIKYQTYGVKETKSTAREDADAVSLITVHSAKGLEWPVVMLSLRKFKPANDEERRLLYVAVTRAKEKLLITFHKKMLTFTNLLM